MWLHSSIHPMCNKNFYSVSLTPTCLSHSIRFLLHFRNKSAYVARNFVVELTLFFFSFLICFKRYGKVILLHCCFLIYFRLFGCYYRCWDYKRILWAIGTFKISTMVFFSTFPWISLSYVAIHMNYDIHSKRQMVWQSKPDRKYVCWIPI